MTEPNIRAAYRDACPGIVGRLLTAHEAAEADAMRAALVDRLLWSASWATSTEAASTFPRTRTARMRTAAWATVLALLLAPDAHT